MLNDIMNVSIPEAILITIFSMAIVFVILLLIDILLNGFKVAFYKEKKEPKAIKKNASLSTNKDENTIDDNHSSVDNKEDEELVAVIASAIASSMSRPVSDIKIRKITRIPNEPSAWARAGRIEQIKN